MTRKPVRLVALLLLLVVAASGCGKKQPEEDLSEISASVTFQRASELLAKRQLRQALAALKKIQFATDTQAELEPLTRLALADATFYQGSAISWIDARNLYLDFVTLNGDHPLAPYAQLQVGLCSLKQVSQPSKDQALTRQAIRDLIAVEERWPDSRYVVAARSMLREARANLAESEFLVARFYLNKKKYPAAIERFRVILARFPDYGATDKVLFHLAEANRRSGNESQARRHIDRVLSDYPNSEYVAPAQRMLEALAPAFTGEVDNSD